MSEFIELITAPLLYPFMQKAFLVSILLALPMSLLSCYVVLKGWSLMGDAIAHAVFPGVVLAYLLNIPFAIGAFLCGDVLRNCDRVFDREFPRQGRYDFGDSVLRHVCAGYCGLSQNRIRCASGSYSVWQYAGDYMGRCWRNFDDRHCQCRVFADQTS